MNPGEEFLEVRLDHLRVFCLAQNLQKVIVADEVEPREHRTLLLEVICERLLANIQLCGHLVHVILPHSHLGKRFHERVGVDGGHDSLKVLVNAPEAGLLLRQCAAREDGLKVQPLALDRVHVIQSVGQVGHQRLPDACLLLERSEKRRRREG